MSFARIVENNATIAEANAQRRAALAELKTIKGRVQRQAAREAIRDLPPFRRATGPTTRQHIRAALRKALNDAFPGGLIIFNPAKHVELDSAKRPKGLIWTEERVAHYRRTGLKPSPVMVWTPEQTGRFLDSITDEPFYAMFHLIAFRGLRRGEACGLRWIDVDFKAETATIATQLVEADGEIEENAPKSDAGDRIVALDAETVSVLKAHRAQQAR